VAGAVISSTIVAYGLARVQIPGRKPLLVCYDR
jgi:ABC-type maltose transport system permease subunit